MKKTTLFLLLTLSTLSATARVFSVRATLNGANVVPANASTGTGTLTGTIDDVSNLFTYTITFTGLTGSVTDAHFHLAVVGVNGSVIDNIIVGLTSPITSAATFSESIKNTLIGGNIYVDLHTTANPGGEIRGQLIIGMELYNEATKNTFYGIGGYSHTDGYIPDGPQPSPYVWTGPSPQNDFSYVATTPDGSRLYGSLGRLSTFNANTTITLSFIGNNVRKLGLNAYEEDEIGTLTSGNIVATVTTNLNNTATLTSTNGARFVGFRVLNQDEYIVSATFSAPTNAERYTSLDDIMFGDDSPQNVALNFDGVDDYVSLPSNVGNFDTNDNFTVSCWFKPDPAANGEQELIGKWDFSSGTNFAFTIRYNSTNGTTYAGQFTNPTFSTVGSSTDLRDGKWHHIAFTKNASVLELVVDGVLAGTGTDNAAGVTTNGLPVNIGRRGGTGSNYFKGEIDEVRIWNIHKTATQIADEMFCKTLTNITNLQASYSFSNGVPHDNNLLISQVQDAVGTNHGTLNGFAKTGDVSNFVTGQVKYVRNNAAGANNGSSWTTAFTDLQTALTAHTCNYLFDVYVAKSTTAYKPHANDRNISFNIPTGMKLYGGFAGTEKSINQRNMALIQTTNETTLTGDLSGNDTPFNFTTNRTDNSLTVVLITGSNASLDGFTIRGAGTSNGVSIHLGSTNTLIKHNKVIDNNFGITVNANNTTIANSIISGNQSSGVRNQNANALTINNSLITNNGSFGVSINVTSGTKQTTISNSTIASNNNYGIVVFSTGTSNNTLKNTLNYGNGSGGIFNNNSSGGTINNTITYSLVQGMAGGSNGNLNGNTVNPAFVSPLTAGLGSLTTNPTNLGDYRLKWCSLAINAGENTGISPLELDRKPRNFGGTTDMGAYEFIGNTPSQVATSNITGTIDSPTYAGGAIETITSTAKIIAPAGAIDFKAPNAIILNPGFEARGVGQYFKAEIGANVGCSN